MKVKTRGWIQLSEISQVSYGKIIDRQDIFEQNYLPEAEVMFELIALALKRVESLVFNSPTGPPAFAQSAQFVNPLKPQTELGGTPVMVQILQERIHRLKTEGYTVLLAEQNMDFALGLSNYAYVLENGRIRHQGRIRELTKNEAVRRTCGI